MNDRAKLIHHANRDRIENERRDMASRRGIDIDVDVAEIDQSDFRKSSDELLCRLKAVHA